MFSITPRSRFSLLAKSSDQSEQQDHQFRGSKIFERKPKKTGRCAFFKTSQYFRFFACMIAQLVYYHKRHKQQQAAAPSPQSPAP
jgi:hypothetical protein